MQYFNVNGTKYLSDRVATQNASGEWVRVEPVLLYPNIKDRFLHSLGYHFSWGQAYCVVCGYERVVDANV